MPVQARRIAFLLGAGASVDAGLPTATGLTDKLDAWLEESQSDLLPALRFVTGALQFGRSCRGERLSSVTNVEDILAACTFRSERNKTFAYPFVGAWHEQLSTIERQFAGSSGKGSPFFELGNACRQRLSQWLTIEEPGRVKYLWSLLDFLNAGMKLDIFTLNYDWSVELALGNICGPVNNDWTCGFDEGGWRPLLLSKDALKVRLYKLHGSLDWMRDEKIGLCSLRWPPAVDSEEISVTGESLLIFGTDAKLQAVDPFLTLLFWFQQRLMESTTIVIIGYSFADRHVNDVIWETMQRDPAKRCIVVNRSDVTGLLKIDPKLARLSEVENRFHAIKATTKEAFESNLIMSQVESVIGEQASEEPF